MCVHLILCLFHFVSSSVLLSLYPFNFFFLYQNFIKVFLAISSFILSMPCFQYSLLHELLAQRLSYIPSSHYIFLFPFLATSHSFLCIYSFIVLHIQHLTSNQKLIPALFSFLFFQFLSLNLFYNLNSYLFPRPL